MDDIKKRVVFERTATDEERLSEAIANLEMVDFHLKGVCSQIKPEGKHKECFDEVNRLVIETLQYLRGIEIKNEIEDYSHFDDIEP